MAFEHDVEALTAWHPSAVARASRRPQGLLSSTSAAAEAVASGVGARELPRYLPGRVYASATLAAFSRANRSRLPPLNSFVRCTRSSARLGRRPMAAAHFLRIVGKRGVAARCVVGSFARCCSSWSAFSFAKASVNRSIKAS